MASTPKAWATLCARWHTPSVVGLIGEIGDSGKEVALQILAELSKT